MATKSRSTASKAKSSSKTKSTASKTKSKSTKPASASRTKTTRSSATTKRAATKKTSTKKPAAKKPAATKKTTAKKPVAKKTATKKPAAKKPAAKKPATKKAVAKTPAAKKPATKSAAPKKPAAKKPAAKAKPKAKVIKLKGTNALDIQQLNFEPYAISKDEDYMNPDQIVHFEHILHGWKHALMEQVDQTVTHLQDEPGNLADPSDRATQEEEFNLELRTRDRERKLISKIDKALAQLKQNDYGYCTQCDEEIGIRRLEARPTASLCIDCKTLAEIREKHYSG